MWVSLLVSSCIRLENSKDIKITVKLYTNDAEKERRRGNDAGSY